MKLLALIAACTYSAPAPLRAPSPGVSPHDYPQRWQVPAVLCVDSRPVWIGKWVCP